MLPERAEKMLKDYKANVGRCAYLRRAITEAEAEINWRKATLAADIATNSPKPADGMPRGNATGNPTERLALILASGYIPDDIRAAESKLTELRRELSNHEMEVCFVEAWLNGLTSKEAWLVEQIYFESCTYNETARAYAQKYGIQMNRDSIRRMKKAVAFKIAKMAE